MSALPPKAVIRPGQPNVRFAPIADIREMDFLQCEGRHFRPAICPGLSVRRCVPLIPAGASRFREPRRGVNNLYSSLPSPHGLKNIPLRPMSCDFGITFA